MAAIWISWHSARLLALILNGLGGLLDYYHRQELNLDEVFALSLANG